MNLLLDTSGTCSHDLRNGMLQACGIVYFENPFGGVGIYFLVKTENFNSSIARGHVFPVEFAAVTP